MNRLITVGLMLLCLSVAAQHEHKQAAASVDTLKKSVPKEVHTQIGETHMMLHYHAPAVRGRMIWGGLVPFGEVWVTGAHSATTWEFNNDIVINKQTVPAGKYAIFTIPDKKKWTIIVNKNWEQHLADEYDAKDDILRIEIKPTDSKHQERLLYRIEVRGKSAELQIAWEKKKLVLPFVVLK